MTHALGELNIALKALKVLGGENIAHDLRDKIDAYVRSYAKPLARLAEHLVLRDIVSTGTPAGMVTALLERLDAHGRFWVYNAAGTELIGGPFLTDEAGWNAINHRGQWSWINTQFAESHIGAEHFAVVEKSESESLEILDKVTRVSTLIVDDLLDIEANGKKD